MKKYAKILAVFGVFAATVNIVNVFSEDVAILMIMFGACFFIFDMSFYCCHGFHSWQYIEEVKSRLTGETEDEHKSTDKAN